MKKANWIYVAGAIALVAAGACKGTVTGLCEVNEDTLESFCSTRPTLDPSGPVSPSVGDQNDNSN